ncbi:hypothetical protein Pen02_79810 [Plantactinospora endophytica]|uniref:Peptidoglycan binding-like domain-containing protein n=1 Tax=Plantactinospora endophytica TaxID=673535 RepID=A0ABQ4EEA2_9ACTN|nr:hypothetical protein Pen02_79810 [Plantactinospora endophytica]
MPLPQPKRVPRGDADRTDVATAATAGDYVALLRQVRERSGLTYREIERRCVGAGHWLPRSTLATMLGRPTLPREDLVVALLTACGRDSPEVERWLTVRQRIAAGRADPPETAATGPTFADIPLHAGRTADQTTDTATVDVQSTTPVESGLGRESGLSGVSGESGVLLGVPGLFAGLRRRAGRLGRTRRVVIVVAGVVVAALAAVLVVVVGPSADARRTEAGTPLVLWSDCPATMVMGANSSCVQVLQERLRAHGFDLPVDGWFGPYTKIRVMAFQVMAGLPSTSIVDDRVKRALHADSLKVPFWPRSEVEWTLREAFPEDPAGAVRLATCLARLDPYWIMGFANGSRRWGLFQFSDVELLALGADSRAALDLHWNVAAARTVWSRTRDFRHWACAAPV